MDEREQLLSAYNSLDISMKRKELADEFTELVFVIKKLQKDIDINEDSDINTDLKKLYDGIISEDEYLNGVYINIINFKEELAKYLDKVTDVFYE